MPNENRSIIRCAIYTRKSSEEGLEQSFNSLEAQREACQAYIASQKHEHWRGVATHYDDGGYSGGSMERPALRQLLQDIDAGKIDTVVVYKVDRLTRSLADFAKIVERLDARQVSFVSVTQQFNTTTSMGRLTLNVLLSFAQFEREVTGERIRDKIAASKRKGMWMGGTLPVGYEVCDRKLVVNAQEAAQVKRIFELYLELGCVAKLKDRLDREGLRSKVRRSHAGQKSGGSAYSRGALYCLLQNPVYVGKVRHRDAIYAGEHEGIIPEQLWDNVQERVRANCKTRHTGSNAKSPSLLVGLLYDCQGNRFTPFHADKRGKRYRYYVSQAKIHGRPTGTGNPTRIPARDIEEIVCGRIQSLLRSPEELLHATGAQFSDAAACTSLIAAGKQLAQTWPSKSIAEQREFLREVIGRIVVHETGLQMAVIQPALPAALLGERRTHRGKSKQETFTITIDARVKRCGWEVRLVVPSGTGTQMATRPVLPLIKAVVRVHRWPEKIIRGEFQSRQSIAEFAQVDQRYAGRILQFAFLAPDIVEAILGGRQPAGLTVQRLLRGFPLGWAEQRKRLGFLNERMD
jgi:DNA invertase Pin-like site-specific DNA recombinase